MLKSMISSISTGVASGGTIDGDLVVTGDFKVEGAGSFAFDEIIEGDMKITGDSTSGSALYVYSNQNFTGTGNSAFVSLELDHASSSGTVLDIRQDGSGDILNLRATSTEVMTVTSTGKVGIGVTDPGHEIDVEGDIRIRNAIHSFATDNRGFTREWLAFNEGNPTYKTSVDYKFHKFQNSDASKTYMVIGGSNDAVGIGTDSPTTIHHVHNSGANTGWTHYTNSSTGTTGNDGTHIGTNGVHAYIWNREAGNIYFGTSATARMVIDDNSRISIANNDSGDKNIIFGERAGNSIASGGDQNNLFGYQTGYAITTGDYNVGIGNYNSYYNQTGSNNTAIGTQSMQGASGQSHSNNTAVGYQTLYNITTGSNNVALGSYAGKAMTDSVSNVFIGSEAGLMYATSNGENVAIGKEAMESVDGGYGNVVIGNEAMKTSGSSNNPVNNVAIGYQALRLTTTGDNNVAVGYRAGYAITTQDECTLIGYQSGAAINNDNSDGIVAVGYQAAQAATENQQYSVFVGKQSGHNVTTGTHNTFLGYYTGALLGHADADNNVFIGAAAGASGDYTAANNTSNNNVGIGKSAMGGGAADTVFEADNNVAVGHESLKSILTGGRNITIGAFAGDAITDTFDTVLIGYDAGGSINHSAGQGQVFIGAQAGHEITTGGHNLAIGYLALSSADNAESYNTAIGSGSMESVDNDSSDHNVAIGKGSLSGGSGALIGNIAIGSGALDSTGTNAQTGTVAIGRSALTALTTGTNNTAIGYEALKTNADGDFNTAVGYQALRTHDRSGTANNTALGYKAGYAVTTAYDATLLGSNAGVSLTEGFGNTAVGSNVMNNMTTGDFNTAVGVQALNTDDVGRGTTAIGYQALYSQNSDSNDEVTGNTALGYHSGYDMTTGTLNTLLGYEAGKALTTGFGNVAIGYQALLKANHTNAQHNIAIGEGVGSEILSGYYNVLIGHNAGDTLTSGNENTIVGHNCDVASGDNVNNIIIGNNITASDNDNRVYIGNDSSYIFNDFNSNATWTHSSDERQKKEIKDDTLGLDFINDIRPVTYKHKSPSEFPKEWNAYNENDKEPMGGDKVIHGLIAQEVKQALDKQGIDTFSGWGEEDDGRQNVSFEAFVLPLIKSVQELSAEVNQLKQQLKEK